MGLQPSSDPRAAVARPAGIKSRPARARAAPSPGSPVSLRFARQWPDRMWAVEGANGVGRPVAQRLLAGGERVLDVPAKLAARARVFDTGQGRKTDATDAHAVVIVALRDQGLGELSVDGSATARHLSKGAHPVSNVYRMTKREVPASLYLPSRLASARSRSVRPGHECPGPRSGVLWHWRSPWRSPWRLLRPPSRRGAPEIVVEDVTQPVFGYNDAIRERVWVETDVDSEGDGVLDLVALDIMRPAATEQGLKSPVVMDASPYFTTLCRGNEGECIADVDGDGLNDRWPLFYDNYFPARLRGHPAAHGRHRILNRLPDYRWARTAGPVAAIDWLNGRRQAFAYSWERGRRRLAQRQDRDDRQVVRRDAAEWHRRDRNRRLGDDRPDQRHLQLVLVHPSRWRPPEWLAQQLPVIAVEHGDQSRPAHLLRPTANDPQHTDGDESGDYTPFWAERTTCPSSTTSTCRCSSSTVCKTTTSRPTSSASCGTPCRSATCHASCG